MAMGKVELEIGDGFADGLYSGASSNKIEPLF